MVARGSLTITNFDELISKVRDKRLLVKPIEKFAFLAGRLVSGEARRNAPKDLGGIESGIDFEIIGKKNQVPEFVIIRSSAPHSAFVEFGAMPHWPPKGALTGWAARHGFPPPPTGDFLVRRAIANPKPGAKSLVGQPFLFPALEDNARRILKLAARTAREIERKLRIR